MDKDRLKSIAIRMVSDHKGLLAADESTGTITKRLTSVGVEATEENRRKYRETLFSTKGLGQYISGAILYDETIRQRSSDGKLFTQLLLDQEIMPGIKVDAGAKILAGSEDEKVTEGLDGLRERVEEYLSLGAHFAKWRAVISIGKNLPTQYCIRVNAHALARYARICQEGGLVPIVEPEVLMDGDHSIEKCSNITEMTLEIVFDELSAQGVMLEGIILKPNMVVSGKDCKLQADRNEVANETIKVLRKHVPNVVPGIMFLSGGQSETNATVHLNAMNALNQSPGWVLSYSYGRALQESALKAWSGKAENTTISQKHLIERARLNSSACAAQYVGEAA